jgi:hypothetical protein
MNGLDSFAETGELGPLGSEAVANLLKVLDSDWQTSNSFAPVPGQSPFGRYEQALIVNEVASAFTSEDVRGKLAQIVHGTIPVADREAIVRNVNGFLYDLENRALHEYSEESSEREW